MFEEYAQQMQLAIDLEKLSTAEDDRSHPKVGAVLLKDGKVIGQAYRGEMGDGDHAEYTLLERKLKDVDVENSILFTTLEPCTVRKTQTTCSQWIIKKRIAKVFIGMLDPNPRIYTKGCLELRDNGIQVEYFPAVLREEIEEDNKDFIAQFRANPRPEGIATFDYTNNDGVFTIGHSDFLFETQWSKASDVSIHVYNNPPSVQGIAVAIDAKTLQDIKDRTIYDMSSRARTVKEGQFVVLKNTQGHYATLQVLDVKDQTQADSHDELTFKYWILTDKSSDFSCLNGG